MLKMPNDNQMRKSMKIHKKGQNAKQRSIKHSSEN